MARRAARSPSGRRPRGVAAATRALQVQLRIELLEVEPLVWRRVRLPETLTLARLHGVLLWSMGWSGGHLHEYEIARVRYGTDDPDWPSSEPILDERRYRLGPMLDDGLRRFTYLYDFGDGWEHRVTVEDRLVPPPGRPLIECLAGENACPPEDVGGPHGYEDFLRVLADPNDEEHEQIRAWIGGSFDPTAFDLENVNRTLATIKL